MRPALEDLIGVRGRTFEVVIEPGKTREFAKATFAGADLYPATRASTAPPTFLASAGYLWGDSWEEPGSSPLGLAGLNLSDLVHGGEDLLFHREPPRVGDRLFATTCIDSVERKQRAHGGTLTVITQLTEFRDERERSVAEVRSTVLVLNHGGGEA
jgi:hypothetical protein